MDYMITIAVLAAFACIFYRKHKKKKSQTAPDAGTVQTSELSPTCHGAWVTTSTGPGTTAPFPYPDGAQAEIYAFDFRKYPDTSTLSTDIETKLNRFLIDCQHAERTAFVHYIPVGTTLLVECIHTL